MSQVGVLISPAYLCFHLRNKYILYIYLFKRAAFRVHTCPKKCIKFTSRPSCYLVNHSQSLVIFIILQQFDHINALQSLLFSWSSQFYFWTLWWITLVEFWNGPYNSPCTLQDFANVHLIFTNFFLETDVDLFYQALKFRKKTIIGQLCL